MRSDQEVRHTRVSEPKAQRRCARRRQRRTAARLARVGLLVAGVSLFGVDRASAATFTVNNTADAVDFSPGDGVCETGSGNGICTLRAAVQEANALAGPDTIDLQAGTYTITIGGNDDVAAKGDLDILEELTISGADEITTIVDAATVDRGFHVLAGVTATVSGLTVRDGDPGGGSGGGIYVLGTLNLTAVTLDNNSAGDGGGLAGGSASSLTLADVTLSGNSATNGGGIYLKDSVAGASLTEVSLLNNTAGTSGGGIYAEASGLALTGGTLSGNTAKDGGGICNDGAGFTQTLTNVTVSGNSATSDGGGINAQSGTLILTNVTISGNSASAPKGGGIRRKAGSVQLLNTIIANSSSGGNCDGTITDNGFNQADDATCGTIPATLTGLDPTLADNGGPTWTHALLAGSSALDTGTNSGCPATDQRGYARPGNGVCDVGAYEESNYDIVIDDDFSEWDDGVGNELCVDDEGGADDWTSPSILDITKFCIASDQTDDVFLLFGFDDVTLNGGNRATACALVDTDDPPNDNADRLICATLAGPGATRVDAVELFVCDDTLSDGCGGGVLTKTYAASAYGFSNTVTGPFGGEDSFVEVKLPYSDLGVAGGSVVFSSLISYPGNSPQNLTAPKDSMFGFGGSQDYTTRILYDLDEGSGATVPVTLAYFRATGGGSVLFEWATASEVGHLGFHLYEVGEDRLRRLTGRLIPSPGGDSLGPRSYRHRSSGVRGELFVLEARDIFGGSQFHGPFELGTSYGREELPDEGIGWGEIRRRRELAERQGAAARRGPAALLGGDRPPAARLLVDRDGIHRVTHAELRAAGVDLTGVAASRLALVAGGRPVPLRVGGSWLFGPGSFVEFVGRAVDSLYTHTNVYTLLVDSRQALPMPSGGARADTWGMPPAFYLESRRVERNRDYHFAAPGGDPWYDTRLLAISGPVEASFDLELEGWLEGAAPVVLDVALWGVTDFPQSPDHHVVLEVNGTEVADEWFDGLAEHPVSVGLPDWLLEPAGNTLRVALPHDTGVAFDLVHYDHYRLTYPRRFLAREGRLSFTAAAGRFRVEALPSSAVMVYRIGESGPEQVRNLEVRGLPGAYSVTFAGSKAAATYHVSTVEALHGPAVEPALVVPDLLDRPAELLIVAHRDFLAGIEPLAAARRGEGLSVRVVDVADVYSRFSHGVVDPEAIRAYLRSAREGLETRYVLLVGGDTYDYLDYLGLGSISFIPTLYAQTHPIVRFAPVDPLLTDLDGDAVPDLAIGRLPVRTAAELQAVVEKTLEYGDAGYAQSTVMAADAFDVGSGVSFSAGSEEMLSQLPPSWPAERAYIDELGVAGAHDFLIQQINAGVGLTNYFGHSGLGVWSFHRLFDLADAAALENSGRPTVVTQWGCWNTYYVSPVYETLAEGLLLAADRGAAAVLGNTALTETSSELALGSRLFAQLALPGQTLGDSLQAAKQDLAAAHPELIDVLLGFTLLGDPTLVLQP